MRRVVQGRLARRSGVVLPRRRTQLRAQKKPKGISGGASAEQPPGVQSRPRLERAGEWAGGGGGGGGGLLHGAREPGRGVSARRLDEEEEERRRVEQLAELARAQATRQAEEEARAAQRKEARAATTLQAVEPAAVEPLALSGEAAPTTAASAAAGGESPGSSHVATPLFRSSSLSEEGFDVSEASCEASLVTTGIPRVQCTVDSMSVQFEEFGDVVSVVVGHGPEEDDELNDGCAIVTFLVPDSARRGRLAELSVPDVDHKDTPLTVSLLSAGSVRDDALLWSMVEQASKVRVDGIVPELGDDASPEKLMALKEDIASCSGVEPTQIELHAQPGAVGWAVVMFKGPKEAAKCLRSPLEMRGKHGIKTVIRARALVKSDLMDDEEDATKTQGSSSTDKELALSNSDGLDLSNLPSISNVMRINGMRTVTEWYTPGDRSKKHTSGAKIGTLEYEISFMDMTRDTWVPAEWLGDLQSPQVMMLLDDMEERQTAADKFIATTKLQNSVRFKKHVVMGVSSFGTAMTTITEKAANKHEKGPQWSRDWPPYSQAEEVLRESIADEPSSSKASPTAKSEDERSQQTGDSNGAGAQVTYQVRFSDTRKFWIPEDVMYLQMETQTLVEVYKEETVALASIRKYIAENPECVSMDRTKMRERLRAAHGWRAGGGLGRHRVDKLLRKVLSEQPVPKSNTSAISRTRATTQAREKLRRVQERERLHKRRLKAMPRSAAANDTKKSSRLLYGDTLEMLGSTRRSWRHRAVLDDTPPIVNHGRLSQPTLALTLPAEDWSMMTGMTLSSHDDLLQGDLLALTDRPPMFDETFDTSFGSAGASELSLSRSLPDLPPVQLSRSAMEQSMLCEALTRRWENEEASIATLRATEALAQSQRRAKAELQAVLKAEQQVLASSKAQGAASASKPQAAAEQGTANDDTTGSQSVKQKRRNRKKGRRSVRSQDRMLYSRKYAVNSPKRFQAKAFKGTWPYVDEGTEPGLEPEPEAEPEPEPEDGSTAVALVDQQEQHVEEDGQVLLPPVERLSNLLETGQKQREALTMSTQIEKPPHQTPQTMVAIGHGAGGVVVRPQVSKHPLARSFYYVTAEGKQSDEVSAATLPELLQTGVLTSETMVCALGWTAWTPLAECKDRLDTGGVLEAHAADLETNKHPTDLARHPAGLSGVTNSSLVEAGYTWGALGTDGAAAAAAATPAAAPRAVPDESLPVSFADIGQSSLPVVVSSQPATSVDPNAPQPAASASAPEPEPALEPAPTAISMDVSITDASSVRHASSDASLLRQGRLRCRQQTLAPTPTRRQTAKGANASAALRVRGAPLSRTQRELAALVADGFDERDAVWALKKAGNAGSEEARDVLLARLGERVPQYELVQGGMVRRNPEGYTNCDALEDDYWRRRSYLDGGMADDDETGPLLLGGGGGGGSASGTADTNGRAVTPL